MSVQNKKYDFSNMKYTVVESNVDAVISFYHNDGRTTELLATLKEEGAFDSIEKESFEVQAMFGCTFVSVKPHEIGRIEKAAIKLGAEKIELDSDQS